MNDGCFVPRIHKLPLADVPTAGHANSALNEAAASLHLLLEAMRDETDSARLENPVCSELKGYSAQAAICETHVDHEEQAPDHDKVLVCGNLVDTPHGHQDPRIEELKAVLVETQTLLRRTESEVKQRDLELAESKSALAQCQGQLQCCQQDLWEARQQLEETRGNAVQKDLRLSAMEVDLVALRQHVQASRIQLDDRIQDVHKVAFQLSGCKGQSLLQNFGVNEELSNGLDSKQLSERCHEETISASGKLRELVSIIEDNIQFQDCWYGANLDPAEFEGLLKNKLLLVRNLRKAIEPFAF